MRLGDFGLEEVVPSDASEDLETWYGDVYVAGGAGL